MKVNSDDHQELAARHGVRGIPDVRLFKDGEEVDRFVGAKPLDQVRAFIRKHCPSGADLHLQRALELLAVEDSDNADRGGPDRDGARRALEAALEVDASLAAAHLELARLDMSADPPALEQAREHLRSVPASHDAYDQAEALLKALDLAADAAAFGDEASCKQRLEADAGDPEALFALGGHAVLRGDYRAALEHYLELARLDRQWRQQAARKAMVTVFQIVGVREPLSEEFRDQLTRVYY